MAREIYLVEEAPSSYRDSLKKHLGNQVELLKKLGVGQGDIEPIVFRGPEELACEEDAQFVSAKLGASAVIGVEFFPEYRGYDFVNDRQCTALVIGSMIHALSKQGIHLPVGSSEQFVIVGEHEIAHAFKELNPNGVATDAFHVDPKSPVMNHYFLQHIKVEG